MDWDDARMFLAVARDGQILAAARRLQLNHATVARRLDRLEAALGYRVFLRRSSGCDLTADGGAFLVHAERMEAAMLAAEASSRASAGRVTGTVRIGAPDGFGTDFLAPRLWRLQAAHPDLTLQLVPVARAFSLSRREADIAVTIERPAEGRLVSGKLVDYGLGLYASADYLRQRGTPPSLDALCDHALVGHVEDLSYSRSLAYAEDLGIAWPAGCEIASAMGQLAAVAAGAGIGILHHFMARPRPELKPVLPHANVRRSYWLVTHQSTANAAAVRVVADAVRALVQEERLIFA